MQAFNAFDEDKDGSIELDEFHSCTTAMGIVLTKDAVKKKFGNADKDADGNIDFNEVAPRLGPAPSQRVLHPVPPACARRAAPPHRARPASFRRAASQAVAVARRCRRLFLATRWVYSSSR